MTASWQRISSREIYANPWISVREDATVKPDGTEGVYGVVTMQHPAVFVVALTDADEVLMVRLHRYTTGTDSWEVPAGGSDGEDPLIAAKRELLEETGYEASTWRQVGFMHALNGIADAPEYVYLATGLTRENRQADVDVAEEQHAEGISQVQAVPWKNALNMVADGSITDGETVAALMHASVALGRVS